MRRSNYRPVRVLALCLAGAMMVFCSPGVLRAAHLVKAEVRYLGDDGFVRNPVETGDMHASVAGQSSFMGAVSEASASIDLLVDPGIRLVTRQTGVPGYSLSAFSWATWEDFVHSPDDLGTLRFGFEVEGTIEVEAAAGGYGGVTANLAMNRRQADRVIFHHDVDEYDPSPYSRTISEMAWFDIAYDPTLQGYSFHLFMEAGGTTVSEGALLADFGHTIRLTQITTQSGVSVADRVSFDSGFRVAAVPEPASLAMAGLGVLGVAGLAIRRRRLA